MYWTTQGSASQDAHRDHVLVRRQVPRQYGDSVPIDFGRVRVELRQWAGLSVDNDLGDATVGTDFMDQRQLCAPKAQGRRAVGLIRIVQGTVDRPVSPPQSPAIGVSQLTVRVTDFSRRTEPELAPAQ